MSNILIDCISLLSPITGIGRYTFEVSKRLQDESEFEIDLFYGYISKKLNPPKTQKVAKSLLVKYPFIKKLARELIIYKTKLFSPKYDLYWQPNFIPTDGIKAKKIVTTVHDFSFIRYAKFHPAERVKYFQKNFFKNIKKSSMIITGSQYTKNEIIKRLNISQDKVKVIYHGVDHKLFRVINTPKTKQKLPKNFILSVGSIEPRKNLLGLLKAYSNLSDEFKKEYKLVLVGFKGWENREFLKLLKKEKENIVYLGFIDDEELVNIYNLATLFVYPSFYEGFGLPVAEAMACGLPVVCSNTSSLPEVGGDGVVYCNPEDIEDITKKIELVLKDKNLQKKLSQKSIKRAQLFTWENSENEHKKLFRELLDR